MASRSEKERFFAELDALDNSSSEDDETKKKSAPHHHQKQPPPSSRPMISPKSSSASNPRKLPNEPTRRRTSSEPPTLDKRKKTKLKKNANNLPEVYQIFRGQTFIFVPNNNVAMTRKRRIEKAVEHGAVWAESWSSEVTHIIVDNDLQMKDVSKVMGQKNVPPSVSLVNIKWFTESLGFNEMRDENATRFQVRGGCLNESVKPTRMPTKVQKSFSEDYNASQADCSPDPLHKSVELDRTRDALDETIDEVKTTLDLPLDLDDTTPFTSYADSEHSTEHAIPSPPVNKGFQCMEKNDGESKANPNARTMEILQKMASYYDRTGDIWRTLAYRKAIAALRKQPTKVETKEQAIAIPQIGERLALKIEEIVTTDRLQRLESTTADPNDQVLQLFMGIYQVGYPTASRWIAQGHRTLDDLISNVPLTPNQKVGIEHYQDFQTRIPRTEVAEHARVVEKALRKADQGLNLIVGGSYRRGTADSGDIDLILTKEDASIEHVRTLVMDTVVPELTKSGFLKVALATGTTRDEGSKWHGASALSGSSPWRRIDLLFVPWDELGAALLYFTGNDIFNRSMRLLASRRGMRLNQHGLYADVMRGKKRQRVTEGRLVEGRSEERIFEILEVPWRPPEHRCP